MCRLLDRSGNRNFQSRLTNFVTYLVKVIKIYSGHCHTPEVSLENAWDVDNLCPNKLQIILQNYLFNYQDNIKTILLPPPLLPTGLWKQTPTTENKHRLIICLT